MFQALVLWTLIVLKMEKTKNILIQELLRISKIYLLNLNEFYPFGITYSNRNFKIVSLEDADEISNPSSKEIQNRIVEILLEEIENPKIDGVGIAIHTEFTLNDGTKKESIEIRLLFGKGKDYFTYFDFTKIDNNLIFKENKKPFFS
jgi:hypothetical protein